MQPEELGQRLHDRVVQRLCSVVIVLGSDAPLTPEDRRRCTSELQAALAEIRALIELDLDDDRDESRDGEPGTVAAVVREACSEDGEAAVRVRCDGDAELPPEEARLVRGFVAEAIRNAVKHARPYTIAVNARARGDGVRVEVSNDGASAPSRGAGTGLGLRLLAADAIRHGGRVDVGRTGWDRWSSVLTLPPARAGAPEPAAPFPRRFERDREQR